MFFYVFPAFISNNNIQCILIIIGTIDEKSNPKNRIRKPRIEITGAYEV